MSRTAAASAAHDRARRARLRARAASEADSPCASPSRSTGRAARRREAAARDRGSRARSRRSAAARRSRRRTSELIVRERCGAARSGLRRLVLLLDELGIRRRRVTRVGFQPLGVVGAVLVVVALHGLTKALEGRAEI